MIKKKKKQKHKEILAVEERGGLGGRIGKRF